MTQPRASVFQDGGVCVCVSVCKCPCVCVRQTRVFVWCCFDHLWCVLGDSGAWRALSEDVGLLCSRAKCSPRASCACACAPLCALAMKREETECWGTQGWSASASRSLSLSPSFSLLLSLSRHHNPLLFFYPLSPPQ